jgi:Zn-dependent metalloprotease
VSAATAAQVAARTTHLRSSASDAELVIYAVGDRARLAWQATASGPDAREVALVDAGSGSRIAGWSEIQEADGKGKTLYSGRVRFQTVRKTATKYLLQERSRGNHRVFDAQNANNDPPTGVLMKDADNVWGNLKASSRRSAAADIAYGHAKTWDFYKYVLGRDGVRNNGTTPRSYVDQGNNYENAYFDDVRYCLAYGDGGSIFRPLVSLDVVAHEMSHGTTARTADLVYFGESGGLNEATSDIFGTMAEFYADNATDRGDYYIGEKIVKVAPGFLRRMDNPKLDAPLHRGATHSYNCWNPTIGADDVHLSSGPANHFFYLLAEGSGSKMIGGRSHDRPTCNGSNVSGIGRTPAGKIWYRALTAYMTSTTDYMAARDATIRAAGDLYGATSTQCHAVVSAWKSRQGTGRQLGVRGPTGNGYDVAVNL